MTDQEILEIDFYDLCGCAALWMSDEDKIKYYREALKTKIMNEEKNIIEPQQPAFLQGAVIGSILRWVFIIINWNHFRIKAHNGKPRIKRIIKLKGFRTALIEEYNGNRCTSRFYWRVGKYYL